MMAPPKPLSPPTATAARLHSLHLIYSYSLLNFLIPKFKHIDHPSLIISSKPPTYIFMMNLLVKPNCYPLILCLLSSSLLISKASKFTFVNKCDYTVWPGILANSGSPSLGTTGFPLPSDTFLALEAPTGWSGRFWGRTGCDFDSTNSLQSGVCATGDCGSGTVECDGAGAQPPATLAEFTLGTGGQDFYDVSLVDGYNLPMLVEPSPSTGGSSEAESCVPTGCLVDLNRMCPSELRAGNGEACRSACDAFGSAEYCCSGAYASPATCKPTVYSEMFKSACPRSYSYAFDDATSTFTCNAADYTITFCPSLPSQKSTTPVMNTPSSSSTGSNSGPAADGSDSGSMNNNGSYLGSGSQTTTAMVGDGSWLAGLAMGDSTKKPKSTVLLLLVLTVSLVQSCI